MSRLRYYPPRWRCTFASSMWAFVRDGTLSCYQSACYPLCCSPRTVATRESARKLKITQALLKALERKEVIFEREIRKHPHEENYYGYRIQMFHN